MFPEPQHQRLRRRREPARRRDLQRSIPLEPSLFPLLDAKWTTLGCLNWKTLNYGFCIYMYG